MFFNKISVYDNRLNSFGTAKELFLIVLFIFVVL